MRTSPSRVTDPRMLECAGIRSKRLRCTAMGCESGRQDSNLRPLVPQTSAYFQAEGRVQLECFCRVLVGKSTGPRKLESAGIECTQLALSRPSEVARSLPYFGGRPRLERAIHTLLRVLAPFPGCRARHTMCQSQREAKRSQDVNDAPAVAAGRRWPQLARTAALTMAAVLAAAVGADVSLVLTFPAAVPSFDATQLSSLIAVLISVPTGAIGVLLAARRPSNPAGWLLGASAVLFALSGLGSDYGFHWLYGHDLSRSLVAPMMLLGAAASQLIFTPLITLLMVFPDGHLLSRRWRLAIWLNALLAALATVVALLDPNVVGDGHRQLPNPIGLAGAHQALMAINNVGGGAFVLLTAVGLISLGIRYRRADADTRQQAKWFGAGVLVLVAAVVVGLITSPTSTWTTPIPIAAETIGFTAFPLCLGVAVLKYRLYGIDLVVNRALVYAALAVFITAVYVGIAVGIGTLVGSGGKPNLGLSIVATAIVAIGFQPLRERLQRVANRLVYGERATPYEVLSQFSERVAESYASDDVLPRMARVLAEGTNADLAEVWLRSGDVLQRAAVFPLQPTVPAAVHVNSAAELSIPAADRAVAVRHQGDALGALTVTKRRGESLTPIDLQLMDDLAHQPELVL